MAKISLPVDTDVFIDYLRAGCNRFLFDSGRFNVFYSVVTRKELLSKDGLRDSERQAILKLFSRCRIIKPDEKIAVRYYDIRRCNPAMEKEDALITATALVKRLPLLTRNIRHFRCITGLSIFGKKQARSTASSMIFLLYLSYSFPPRDGEALY